MPGIGRPPRVFLQHRDGSLTEAVIEGERRSLMHLRDAAFGDFNGGLVRDVVIVGHGYDAHLFPAERSVVLLGLGHGGYVERSIQLPGRVNFTPCLAIGDVNKDGCSDVFLGNIFGQQPNLRQSLFGGSKGFHP